MTTSTRPGRPALTATLTAALAALLVLTGCSSSGGGKPAGQPAGKVSSAGGGSVGGGTVGGGGGGAAIGKGGGIPGVLFPAQVLALCKKIPAADIQALLVPKVQGVASGPTGCAFLRPGEDATGDNLTADLRNDTDGTGYTNLSGAHDHPLAGVGDKAYWNEAVQGQSAPEVTAAKGKLICVVQTPADVGVLTIAKTGSAPIYQVSDAAAAAYSAKLGKLCTDLFAAAG